MQKGSMGDATKTTVDTLSDTSNDLKMIKNKMNKLDINSTEEQILPLESTGSLS
jgi:hypothetical protein